MNIFLADALASPSEKPPGQLTLTHRVLTEEHEAARQVKNKREILVCLGNPPYDRERRAEDGTKSNKGGWVRFGDQLPGGAKQEKQGEVPILEDFLEPARKAGKGLNLQVIFNDYVYFWRWALWRMFEKQQRGGIVTFITASSYLAGPGFVGVREEMRRTFDELWILDLGGDNLGARKTPNVFAIQIPVAIAIGVRGTHRSRETPALVRYAKIEGGSRNVKLANIDAISELSSIGWQECGSSWHDPFLPVGKGDYFDWPKLTQILPYHTAGAVFYRSWPIAEEKSVLEARWDSLKSGTETERQRAFKESRDRKFAHMVRQSDLPGFGKPSVRDLSADSPLPGILPYGFRSFDRQKALYDFRLGDFIRPDLYRLVGAEQLFLVAPDSMVAGQGPIAVVSSAIPDQHHFCGRGGKDVVPLYRDNSGKKPNVTRGLLDALGMEYGFAPTVQDLAAYAYALLGGQSYSKRFWNELETPGPRVPVTKDGVIFAETTRLGRRMIWLHTYAERFRGDDRGDELPQGSAAMVRGVSSDPAAYPQEYGYAPSKQEITVGDGRFGPVSTKVWEFEVSGLKVVQSWLAYRMKKRKGKKSSPLDDIRPQRRIPRMSDEFMELLWVLEATLAMEPQLKDALDKVVAGPCFTAAELPQPQPHERKPPAKRTADGELLKKMGSTDAARVSV